MLEILFIAFLFGLTPCEEVHAELNIVSVEEQIGNRFTSYIDPEFIDPESAGSIIPIITFQDQNDNV